ncbi:MAG: hypothetical protein FJW39_04365 [Acidobacteria bacterium]|nr:hypothetical protein [Acidobacteriota bacterium]
MSLAPPEIRILADDLTGACDTGAAFAGRGLRTIVSLDGQPHACDVLVISTASRADSPADAYAKVRAACETLAPGGRGLFYKKIDSTLRGPVAAEIRACIDSGGRVPAIVCPAFPAQRRTVVGGRLWAPGVSIDLGDVLAGLPVRICDASTADDLEHIAASLLRAPVPLAAGSAGLARAIAGFYGSDTRASAPRPVGGPVVLCVGSDHPATAAQLSHLEQARPSGWELHRVDFSVAIPGLASKLEAMRNGGVFFCGGDTAAHVCGLLGVRAIQLDREVLPGVPIGRLIGGPCDGLAVVTKSGGFGAVDVLSCVVDALSAQNRKTA